MSTGYAILIGIGKFENDYMNRISANSDAIFWKEFLKKKFYYPEDHIHLITDEMANLPYIIYYFSMVAKDAVAGDIVTIYLGSHGTYRKDNHILHLYRKKERLDEKVFYTLLSFFKPGVKIILMTDFCHSGTFVADDTPPICSEEELQSFLDATIDSGAMSYVFGIYREGMSVTAKVAHLSTVEDHLPSPDIVFTRYIKELYNVEYSYNFETLQPEKIRFKSSENYTLYQLREKLQQKFREDHIAQMERHCYYNLMDYVSENDELCEVISVDLGYSLSHDQPTVNELHRELNYNILEYRNFLQYIADEFISSRISFDNRADHEGFSSNLYTYQDIIEMLYTGSPTLRFIGTKTNEFYKNNAFVIY